MTTFGRHGRILHIDLTARTTEVEQPDETFFRLFAEGGLLGTYYLLKHTTPGIDPLGPENLLVFANSVVAGYPASGLVRYVVCAKSPLTNGVGEARTEGPFACALTRSGYDALIFRGASIEPVGLMIDDGGVTFFDAKPLWGCTVGQANDRLDERLGKDLEVAAIGLAGENLVRFASIVSSRTHQVQRTLLESDAMFKILISPAPMIGPDDAHHGSRLTEGHDQLKRDNHSNPGGFEYERDAFFDWLIENDFLSQNFYIVVGDRHWQYHSRHPRGFEEFSPGALVDANSRMGRPPGDPDSNDPDARIEQLYTYDEPTGGFLRITVSPGPEPTTLFRFHDENGVVLHEVEKVAGTY